ncbi:MAG: glycosyltransferase, partial [Candidatus Hadarchaeota archaeon]
SEFSLLLVVFLTGLTMVFFYDFLITLKIGKGVQASSDAKAFTTAPESWKDLYLQRLRWYRGTLQTIFKHRNVFDNPRFGYLHKLNLPYLLFSLIFLPIAGFLVLGSLSFGVLTGFYVEIGQIFLFFLLLMALISVLAIQMDKEDWKLTMFSPFFLIGYKNFLDVIKVRSLFDLIFGREVGWTGTKEISPVSEKEVESYSWIEIVAIMAIVIAVIALLLLAVFFL